MCECSVNFDYECEMCGHNTDGISPTFALVKDKTILSIHNELVSAVREFNDKYTDDTGVSIQQVIYEAKNLDSLLSSIDRNIYESRTNNTMRIFNAFMYDFCTIVVYEGMYYLIQREILMEYGYINQIIREVWPFQKKE